MTDLIKINTEQVLQISNKLDELNNDLQSTLMDAQKAVNNLDSVWSGEAATATIDAVNSFAQEYFQDYHDLIDQYVVFLRSNVVSGYEETENNNTRLADSFK